MSGFRYTKQVLADDTAVLEFKTSLHGKYVNGVDIIRCNESGRIVEFPVMIRPLQAVNIVHQQMKAMLATRQEHNRRAPAAPCRRRSPSGPAEQRPARDACADWPCAPPVPRHIS